MSHLLCVRVVMCVITVKISYLLTGFTCVRVLMYCQDESSICRCFAGAVHRYYESRRRLHFTMIPNIKGADFKHASKGIEKGDVRCMYIHSCSVN